MKPALRMGRQMIMYHIVAMILSLLFISMLGSILWLQIVLSLLLLLAYGWMLYGDGCARGERAATLSVQMDRQLSEGRAVDAGLASDVFKKSTAWKGYLIGVSITALIAIANIAAEPFYPPYQPVSEAQMAEINATMEQAQQMAVQSELAAESGEVAAVDATAAPEPASDSDAEFNATGVAPINWFNVVARVVFMPFLFLYSPLQYHAVLLNWLFLALALLVPLAEPIGYLQGPKLRQKKLALIEQGKKRKMRNLKVNKKPRTPKKPKMEV